VKRIGLIVLLSGAVAASAQEEAVTLDDMIQSAKEWAKENLDEETLRSISEVDQEKVNKVLERIQKEFQGEYVINLAPLREAAKNILPVLESHDETQPYAPWLQKEREIWIRKLSARPWPPEAKPYVARLKPIFIAHRIPPELIWLAEVESSFDPVARSPAGAVGLFQLMPATAKQYGLRTWPVDQRIGPELSAAAAAKFLADLHRQFKDWRLVLAAYNSGGGTVQKLLKRYKATTYDAIATRLPAETQLFVPKVEATILRREGVKLSDLPAPRDG
jgi:membrane-bound lytic murein transglycosylase D